MKNMWMIIAASAMIAPVMADEAAPAPEAATQEKCEIEQIGVNAMIERFLKDKKPVAWTPGRNELANGAVFFVATGTGVIQAPRDSASYIDSRVNAFNKAMYDAKKQMVEYLGVEIGTETMNELASGDILDPKPSEEEALAQKQKQLYYAKLNEELKAKGIDPVQDPVAAKEAMGKMLNSEQYKKIIRSVAQHRVVGLQACCTFESIPKDAKEKGEIGVVAVWSPKLQSMAASIVTGKPVAKLGAKKRIIEQIPTDPKVLISTYGVQQKIDEKGDLVLVAFGQAGAPSESKMSAKVGANKARQNAMAAIREFAGEQVAVTTDTMNAESTQEFENDAEKYEDESSFKEKIEATAKAMKISGIAPLKSYTFKHPVTGRTVYGQIVTWCPKQAGQARDMSHKISKVPEEAVNRPNTPNKPNDLPPSDGHESKGAAGDDDAI